MTHQYRSYIYDVISKVSFLIQNWIRTMQIIDNYKNKTKGNQSIVLAHVVVIFM